MLKADCSEHNMIKSETLERTSGILEEKDTIFDLSVENYKKCHKTDVMIRLSASYCLIKITIKEYFKSTK